MNKSIGIKKGANFGLYDLIISLLVITALSLYDIKLLFLGTQAVAFGFSAIAVLKKNKMARVAFYFLVWLAIFAGYSLFSAVWASESNSTVITCTLSIVQVGLIAFCIIVYCDREERKYRLIHSFVFSSLFLSFRFFVTVPTNEWGQMSRFSEDSIFGSNSPAMVLSFSVVFLFYSFFLRTSKIKGKGFALALMCVFSLITFLMGTKKGLIIIVLGVGLLYISEAKNSIRLVKSLIVVFLALGIAYYAIMNVSLLYGSIGYRVESLLAGIAGNETDFSTEDRSFYARDAFRVFKQHVILGVGQDGYRYENSRAFTYSHNNFVEVLANLGIIGFLIYYSIYVIFFISSWKKRKISYLPVILIFILLVLGVSLVSYSDEMTYVVLSMSIALTNKTENVSGNWRISNV